MYDDKFFAIYCAAVSGIASKKSHDPKLVHAEAFAIAQAGMDGFAQLQTEKTAELGEAKAA